jgi:hypothetical protein
VPLSFKLTVCFQTIVITEMRQTFMEMSTDITSLRREVALVDVITVIDPFGNSQTVLRVDAIDCAVRLPSQLLRPH